MSHLPSGSKIAGIAAHIAVMAFFLPWIAVSCAGIPLGDTSGYGLATGKWNSPFGGFETDPLPAVFLILAAAVVLTVMFYVAYNRGSADITWNSSQIIIALAALAILGAVTFKTISDNTSGDEPGSIDPQIGLLLTVGSFITVMVASYLAIVDIRRLTEEISMQTESARDLAPSGATKKCPYCAENILADAIVCRHCGRDLVNIRDPLLESSRQSKLSVPPPDASGEVKCPNCGTMNEAARWDYCMHCGFDLRPEGSEDG